MSDLLDNIMRAVNTPPRYIRIEGIEMQYNQKDGLYFRDAGIWSLNYKYYNGILVADCPDIPWLDNKELVEISRDEWEKGNKGYVQVETKIEKLNLGRV